MKAKKAAAAVSAAALCLGSMSAAYVPVCAATETGAAVTTGELRDAISSGSEEAEIPASDDPDTALIGTHEKSADETRTEAEVQNMVKESGSFGDIAAHYGYTNKGTIKGSQLTPGDIVTFRATQTSADPQTGTVTSQKSDITCIYVEFTAANGLKTQQLWKVSETGEITEERNVNVQADYYNVWHAEKKPASYTVPTGLAGTKRKTLSTVALPSGFSWKAPDTIMSTEGTQEFDAVYTPDNDMLYTAVELKISVSVQANIIPLVRPEEKYTVYYEPGQTLASVALPDGWAFENPAEVLKPGTASYKAVFTGDRDQDYSASTDDATVSVEVIRRSVSIAPISITVSQGTSLTNSLLPGNAFGALRWEKTGQKMSEAGTFTVYARFTPSDKERYASQDKIPVTVTVKKKASDTDKRKTDGKKDDDSKKNKPDSSSSSKSSSGKNNDSGTLDVTPSGDSGSKKSSESYEPASSSGSSSVSEPSSSEKSTPQTKKNVPAPSLEKTSPASSSSSKKKAPSVSAADLKKRDPSPLNIDASQITTLSSNQRMLPDLTASVKKTGTSSKKKNSKGKKDAISDVVAITNADAKKKKNKEKSKKEEKSEKKKKTSEKTEAKDTDDQTAGSAAADTSDEFTAEDTSDKTASKKSEKRSFFSAHKEIIIAAGVAVLAALGAAVGIIAFRKRSGK